MLTALFSFLGGSAFRLVFGAVMDFFNKKQDHAQEMELQRLQSDLEAQRHARDLERIGLQAKLNVQQIEVATAGAISTAEANAFMEAVKATAVRTGVAWADAWNQSIRPAGATVSLLMWVVTMAAAGFTLAEFDQTLIAAFLGVFVGERIHGSLRTR